MYILRLNDMRGPKVEVLTDICIADTKEELENFIKTETVESYKDETPENKWTKVFKKGGPLEWYNPPTSIDHCFMEILSEEDYVERKRTEYKNFLESIPRLALV